MITVTVEEVQAHLAELIDSLAPGGQVVIVRDQHPIAKLIGESVPARKPAAPGSAKGAILHMADDFDAPLEDFREYME